MKRNNKIYIEDILDSVAKIDSYTKGMSFKSFAHNKMVVDAVIRNFEIIGEAAKNLPQKTKSIYKGIPCPH